MYYLDLVAAQAMMSLRRDRELAEGEMRLLLAGCKPARTGRLSTAYRQWVSRLGKRLVAVGEYLERSGLPHSLA